MISNIYRKFKSYIYYDKTSLYTKRQICEFENDQNFDRKLETISKILFGNINDDEKNEIEYQVENWINGIDVNIIPKIYRQKGIVGKEDINYVTNVLEEDKSVVEKMNYIFKGPIELHLIVFFWVLKYAKYLEKEYSDHNYANRLIENCCNVNDSSVRTFKPYFKDYANWRDNGIRKAQETNRKGEGCAILMLDICSYYYNVNFSFEIIDGQIKNEILDEMEVLEYERLSNYVLKILLQYNSVLGEYNKNLLAENQISLPLGLSISPIIANYYLTEFDKTVVSEIHPIYYGRYVDDIMIVLNENSFMYNNSECKDIKSFIDSNFILKHKLFSYNEDKYILNDINFNIKYGDKIAIQNDKIKLYILDKNGTPAILEKFADNIKKNSSEFRFIPEESNVINDFFGEAYSMIYNDTQNKLRSIETFKGNKFGVSKYLAKIIHTSKYWNDDYQSLDMLTDQVDSFFVGRYCLEYYLLWEKIFVFYIINRRFDKVEIFYKRIEKLLKNLEISGDDEKAHKNLSNYLLEFRNISLASAGALNFEVFDDSLDHSINELSIKIRKANMLNHNYIILPLLNYTNGADENSNLLELNFRCSKDINPGRDLCQKCSKCDMDIYENSNKVKYSPRFIHYHELQLYSAYIDAYTYPEKDEYFDCEKKFLSFNKINNTSGKKIFPDVSKISENPIVYGIKIPIDRKMDTLKIGIASMKVESKNIEQSYLKRPNLSRNRLNELIKLLNYIEKTNSDLVVLPEVSIPFSWMGILSQFAQRIQKALIFGLEHIINRNSFALNYLVTIIPFKFMNINSCFVKLRLKNYYSPGEIRLLKGYRYQIPEEKPSRYDIFNWNSIRFGCLNCFELADISDRAYFKNKVDFLTASEYNKDTNYFSNIAESVSRDLHCYFIQSNSSDFGDSRIIKPSKSQNMDIVRLKGGINYQVVVGEIDIKKLRNFQYKEFELQKDDDSFKPTPPNFDKIEIEKILAE